MDYADDVVGFGAAIPAFLQVAPVVPPLGPDDINPDAKGEEE